MYTVELSREAEKFLRRCDAVTTGKLERCFRALEQNPRSGNNVRPLRGPLAGTFRYRVGDYRVVYSIDERVIKVFVITIAHRSSAYE